MAVAGIGAREFWRWPNGVDPMLAIGALLFAAMIPPTLLLSAVDDRTLNGAGIWLKPLKFQISLVIYLGTLAWAARWTEPGSQNRPWRRVLAGVILFTAIAEIAWIMGAAALGQPSHFNMSTPFWGALYGLMGVFAVILTAASAVFAVLIARAGVGLRDPMRLAWALGLMATTALTLPVAGALAQQAVPVGDLTEAAVWPFFGWSREGGDLRAAHFVATHALQIVPAVGALALWMSGDRSARFAGLAATLGLVALTAALTAEAFAGRPPFSLLGLG